jgi:hypothetical protein
MNPSLETLGFKPFVSADGFSDVRDKFFFVLKVPRKWGQNVRENINFFSSHQPLVESLSALKRFLSS